MTLDQVHSRYFTLKGDGPILYYKLNPRKELLASLEVTIEQARECLESRTWSFAGLYHGPTGLAYLFFQLAQYESSLEIQQCSMIKWARFYLDVSRPLEELEARRKHGGIGDEATAWWCVSTIVSQNRAHAEKFLSLAAKSLDPTCCSSNEWLYGRAGTLYLLRLLKKHVQDESIRTQATDLSEKLARMMLDSPRPWTWHGKHYLGAAHGDISIISQLVLSCPQYAAEIKEDLVVLLKEQLPNGNWPSSLPAHGKDSLVQFCHGAPGMILSLDVLLPYFPDLRPAMESAIAKGKHCISERGLLRKEACLCHGNAGNVLALDDKDDLQISLTLMTEMWVQWGWEGGLYEPESFPCAASLFEGPAGRAWAWLVFAKELERRIIGYSDV